MQQDFNKIFPDKRQDYINESTLRQSQLVMLRTLKIVDFICKKHHINYWIDGGTLLGAVRHGGFIPWDDDIDIGMTRKDYDKFLKIAPKELPEDLFLESPETADKSVSTWAQVKDRKSFIEQHGAEGCHPGMYMDVFPFDSYSNNFFRRNFHEKLHKHLFIKSFLVNAPFKKPFFKGSNFPKNVIRFLMKLTIVFSIFNHKKIYKWSLKSRDKRIASMRNNEEKNYGYGTDVLNWDKTFKADDIFPLKTMKFEDVEVFVPNNFHNVLSTLYGESYMTPPPEYNRIPHNTIMRPIISIEEEREINKKFVYKKM